MVDMNNPVENDEVESNASVAGEGASQDVSGSQTMGIENRDTFFQIMNEWFA